MLRIKLAQFAVRGALPPRRSESPVCTTDNKASCMLHLLGWFIGSRGFSSLERRPEFWVLHKLLKLKCEVLPLRFHTQPGNILWKTLNDWSAYSYDPMTKKNGLKISYLCCHKVGKWTHLSGGTIHDGDQSAFVIRDNLSKYWNFGYDTMTTGKKR